MKSRTQLLSTEPGEKKLQLYDDFFADVLLAVEEIDSLDEPPASVDVSGMDSTQWQQL